MPEITGWLFDMYAGPTEEVVLWVLGDDGARHRLWQPFPVTFYAAGPAPLLRALWRYLEAQPVAVTLARAERRDLFQPDPLAVLAIQVSQPAAQPRLFQQVSREFPTLSYYDADVALTLRYAAAQGVFPLARCRVLTSPEGQVQQITALDSPWELDPVPPPLRVLSLEPDSDPAHATPTRLALRCERSQYRLPLAPARSLLVGLRAILERHDPDLLLSSWGDTWLLPHLLDLSQKTGLPLPLNREPDRPVEHRPERTYFSYGQVVYQGRQVLLSGRWHIDRYNAMLFHDYGMDGILELARVTCLARSDRGAGLAGQRHLGHADADRPAVGHLDPLAQTAGRTPKDCPRPAARRPGWAGLPAHCRPAPRCGRDRFHLDVPQHHGALQHLAGDGRLQPGHCRGRSGAGHAVRPRVARSPTAWPGAADPGSSAREAPGSQEARGNPAGLAPAAQGLPGTRLCSQVAAGDLLRLSGIQERPLRADRGPRGGDRLRPRGPAARQGGGRGPGIQRAAYVRGWAVGHPAGASCAADLQPLLDEILERTGLPIALEGIYRWVAFLPSRVNERVPVANRYFGVFQDGSVKLRGIEARRRDTPPFIAQTQLAILAALAQAYHGNPQELPLAQVLALLRRQLKALRQGSPPPESLLVAQKLSRALDEFRTPSPVARAAAQLQAAGKSTSPGQRIRFLYTRGDPGVQAWDLPQAPDPASLDAARYSELLLRAAGTMLEPFGISEDLLRQWLFSNAAYAAPPGVMPGKQAALPLLKGGRER